MAFYVYLRFFYYSLRSEGDEHAADSGQHQKGRHPRPCLADLGSSRTSKKGHLHKSSCGDTVDLRRVLHRGLLFTRSINTATNIPHGTPLHRRRPITLTDLGRTAHLRDNRLPVVRMHRPQDRHQLRTRRETTVISLADSGLEP